MPQVAVDASGNKIRWDEKKKSWVPVERASDSSGNIVEFDGVKWNPVKQEAKSVAPAGANKTIAESIKGGDIPIPFTAPETGTEPIWTTPVFNKGYWEQVGSGSYWTDAYRNLMRGAKEMEPMSVYTKTMGKTIGMMLAKKQFDKKYGDKAKEEYAKQVSPETAEKIWPSSALGVAGEAGKGLAKGAFDFVTWLPKTAYNFVRDPLTTLREDPLGTIFLFSGVSAGAKTLWKKHKSGKVILPKELRGLEAELKTWAMSNKDSAQKYAQIIESAQKRESLAKEMSPGVSEVSAGVEFGDPLRSKTGVSPRAVRGPGVPTEAAAIAERLKPVPVGEVSGGSPVVSGPTREFDVSGFNRVMPGQPAVSGPGVEWGEPGSVKLPPAKKPPIAISEEPAPGLTEITPPKVLDITSSQMKLGLDEFENLKKAYSGFPILSEDLMKYIKSGRLVPAQKQENVPGAIKPAPAKVVGMGDFKTDIPRYTTKPRDKSIADPFKVEKNAGGMETGMPGYKHELDSLLKQRDMAATQIKHEYENPVRWFDNSPFLKETLYYPWREAHNQHMFEKIGFRKEIDLWKSKVNGKKAEHDLGAYAIAKQKNGPETLQLMGIDPADVVARVEADPAMMKVYDTARVRLEEMFVRINKSRELLGMSPLPKVENYFTFARGVTDLSSMGINPVTISDPAMIKRHLYEPTFQYKKRENVIGPMSTKFFGIYEHYMNSASKYSLYSPVVAKGRVLLGDWNMTDSLGRPAGAFNLKETAPNLYNMTSEWVDRIAGKSLKTNNFVSKMLGALARNTGTAVIAFNPRSALIQPTSLANTYVEVGAKNLINGVEEFALKSNRKLAMRESKVLTGRAMDFHLEDLWAEGVSGAINKGKAKASEVGSYPLRLLDAISAKMSWLAGVERGKQLGLTGKELYRYADDVVVKTQASAAIGDVARVQTTPIGKLGTIFQTFVINNWNYWSKEVFGWKNPNMATPDRVKKVSRLILSSILINSLFEDVIGINSPLPAPEREIIDGIRKGESVGKIGMNVVKEIGESIPFVGGAIKYTDDKFQSYPPIVQQGVDMSKLWSSIQRAVGKGDIKAFSVRDWEMVAKIIGVPGGAVAGQMYRKAQAGMPWWKILMGAPSRKAEKSYPTSIPR